MSGFTLQREHRLGLEEARAVAERIRQDLERELDCDCQWKDETMEFRRRGVVGWLTVSEQAVELKLKLGMPFAIWGSKFEEKVSERFATYYP